MTDQLPVDIEAAAALLYEQPPADFIAVRSNLAASANARGEHRLAESIKKLRKPTVSAWSLNLLSRYAAAELDELLELGPALAAATRRGQATELRNLSARRGQLVGVLMQRARRLLAMHRLKLSASVAYEVESTLTAAVADPDVAAAVRTGRLERSTQYAGLGPGPPLRLVPDLETGDEPETGAGPKRAGTRQRITTGAAAVLEAASRRRDKAVATRDALTTERDTLAADWEQLAAERDRLTAESTDLERRLAQAQRALQDTAQRLKKIQDALAATEIRLTDATDAAKRADRDLAAAERESAEEK